jgi:hypothetical protein
MFNVPYMHNEEKFFTLEVGYEGVLRVRISLGPEQITRALSPRPAALLILLAAATGAGIVAAYLIAGADYLLNRSPLAGAGHPRLL